MGKHDFELIAPRNLPCPGFDRVVQSPLKVSGQSRLDKKCTFGELGCTCGSLRWVGARLHLGHDSNAGRSPRKMRAADVRKTEQIRRQLESIVTHQK